MNRYFLNFNFADGKVSFQIEATGIVNALKTAVFSAFAGQGKEKLKAAAKGNPQLFAEVMLLEEVEAGNVQSYNGEFLQITHAQPDINSNIINVLANW